MSELIPLCPVCKTPAAWGYREEQDAELNTVYAFLQCPQCGIRSREVISLQDNRAVLLKEWTPHDIPNVQPVR